jgi:hypothetical protein
MGLQSSVKNLGLAINHEDAFESILIKIWEILYVIFQAWVLKLAESCEDYTLI